MNSTSRQRVCFLLAAFSLLSLVAHDERLVAADEPASRVTQDLLVLYTFERPVGGIIKDRSGTGEPLDLKVEASPGVQFRGGKLTITSSARIASTKPAMKIVTAVKQSNGLTIEAWVRPQDKVQAGPARIVSMSSDPGHRDFTLGQDATFFDVRLRTTGTNENGIPSTATPADSLSTELTHVVFTRDPSGKAQIYLNGKETAARDVSGDFSNWSDEFKLVLANELTGDRTWLGEIQLVAIYGRALSSEEATRNFAAGVPSVVDYAKALPPAASRAVDFVKDVQPIFKKACYECHSAGNIEGGLNLGIRQQTFEGGDHGPVLTRGDSADSRLIHLVAALEPKEVMPPDGDPLTKDEVGILRAWIDQGAKWPDGTDVLDPRTEKARTHWAFQPLRDIPEPTVKDANWPRTPIDRFILAKLESAGLQPQQRASPRQLIRRVTFDLIGLPPTPDEIREFEAASQKDSQAAIESLIDRLLQSPHYGERWGRHWLDVARYAESDGQESDHDRPEIYHYRDFVIRSFNGDRPYDEFVRWQLAGNEYEPQNPVAVAATGFLVAGPYGPFPEKLLDDERLRTKYNELDDMLSTIGTGLMGLTLACARCHDHKYDAIPTRDYYRLLSALHSGSRAVVPLGSNQQKVLAFRDRGAVPETTWLFQRADYYDRDQPVQLGFVSILTTGQTPDEYWQEAKTAGPAKDSTNQRRALADWITDVDHGAGAVLARVIVNRLWQHHFGQGIVRTVGDFGVRSDPPTHPELLEWLARDLVQNGWKLKRLQRLMLTSAVYQQSSSAAAPPAADPDNKLLWRMPLQRLEAEVLRDSLLAVSGTLNLIQFGPSVKPPIAAEAMLARNVQDPYPGNIADSPELRRRSIYLFHKRVVPYPLLQAFDKPDAQQSCSRRDQTTVAPQALALLNDRFIRSVAMDFASRLIKAAGNEPTKQIESAYQLALGRSPSDSERTVATNFVQRQIEERTKRNPQTALEETRQKSLADFCQAVFSLNEFLYVD